MTAMPSTETSIKKNARVAGALYLALVLAAPLRLIYVPSVMYVARDAAATASKIAAHQTLFRLGITADLLCGVILIFLTLALYGLFEGVDRGLAMLMVISGGVLPAAIDFFNVVNDMAALMLVRGATFLEVFEKPQRDALAMFFLRLHEQEIVAAQVLWGLWLFPLALLTIRSRFLPRILGYWLILNGIAYIASSLTGIFFPQYQQTFGACTFPALLGEVAFMLWLVIKGAKPRV